MKYRKFLTFALTIFIAMAFIVAPATATYRAHMVVGELVVEKWARIDGLLQAVANTTGNVRYVYSGNGIDGVGAAGKSRATPFATLDYAIGQMTANNNDFIVVMAGHEEDIDAADGWDADVAGITILGLGDGTDMPEFTFSETASTVAIGAANVSIYNLRFLAGVSAIVIGVAVEAAGTDALISDCYFPEPTTSTFEFIDAIDLEALVAGLTVQNTIFFNADSVGGSHFIEAGNGVNTNIKLLNNYVYGEFAVSAVWSNDTDLEWLIKGGTYTNLTNGQHALEFVTGAATGQIIDVLVRTDAQGTAVDPGSMTMHNVYWDDDATADSVAIPVVAGGESTQALTDVHLDHLMALDGATQQYPEQAVDDSTICKMLADDDPAVCSTYDNATDSLEAISNKITVGTDTLSGIDMDHLMLIDGATQKYPENAATDSTICKILGDDDPALCSTYDNATDSLEAIGNLVAATAQQTNNDTSLATIHMDHLLALDGTTSKFPEQAVGDSTICKILGDDDPAVCTTYDNSTDSLEAIGAKTDTIDTKTDTTAAATLSYDSPNYFVVSADLSSATWNTVAAHEIAEVTGSVRMKIMVEVSTSTTTVSNNGTLSLGWAGNTAAIFALTDIEGGAGALVGGNIVSYVYGGTITGEIGGGRYFAETAASTMADIVLVGGVDVGYSIAVNAGATGILLFHVWWTPLDATGAVTAGAGGPF